VVLEFPRGLPGFENDQRFTLTNNDPPLALLQSVAPGGPCFHAIPVAVVDPDYQIDITDEDQRVLALDETRPPEDQILCLAIVSSTDGTITANLLAPVVVNLSNGIGVQAVRADDRYSHRHPVGAADPGRTKC